MASDRVSIYLPDHLGRVLDRAARDIPGGGSLSARIAAIIDRYGVIIDRECPPLSHAEWSIILDACNGWATFAEVGETLMCGIALEVHDHARLNGAGEKWGLSTDQVADLVARLNGLRPAETMAIVERIERFWRRHTMPTDEAMAAAGIVPAAATGQCP